MSRASRLPLSHSRPLLLNGQHVGLIFVVISSKTSSRVERLDPEAAIAGGRPVREGTHEHPRGRRANKRWHSRRRRTPPHPRPRGPGSPADLRTHIAHRRRRTGLHLCRRRRFCDASAPLPLSWSSAIPREISRAEPSLARSVPPPTAARAPSKSRGGLGVPTTTRAAQPPHRNPPSLPRPPPSCSAHTARRVRRADLTFDPSL